MDFVGIDRWELGGNVHHDELIMNRVYGIVEVLICLVEEKYHFGSIDLESI